MGIQNITKSFRGGKIGAVREGRPKGGDTLGMTGVLVVRMLKRPKGLYPSFQLETPNQKMPHISPFMSQELLRRLGISKC